MEEKPSSPNPLLQQVRGVPNGATNGAANGARASVNSARASINGSGPPRLSQDMFKSNGNVHAADKYGSEQEVRQLFNDLLHYQPRVP